MLATRRSALAIFSGTVLQKTQPRPKGPGCTGLGELTTYYRGVAGLYPKRYRIAGLGVAVRKSSPVLSTLCSAAFFIHMDSV